MGGAFQKFHSNPLIQSMVLLHYTSTLLQDEGLSGTQGLFLSLQDLKNTPEQNNTILTSCYTYILDLIKVEGQILGTLTGIPNICQSLNEHGLKATEETFTGIKPFFSNHSDSLKKVFTKNYQCPQKLFHILKNKGDVYFNYAFKLGAGTNTHINQVILFNTRKGERQRKSDQNHHWGIYCP